MWVGLEGGRSHVEVVHHHNRVDQALEHIFGQMLGGEARADAHVMAGHGLGDLQ